MKKVLYKVLGFITVCFLATSFFQLSFWEKLEQGLLMDLLIFLIPGLTVIFLYQFHQNKPFYKNQELGLNLKGIKYWLIAPLFVITIGFLSYAIAVVLNPELLKSQEEIRNGLIESGFNFRHIIIGLPIVFFLNIFLGSLVSIPAFLGQELGWRAFLNPHLDQILNPAFGYVLGGVVWGFWNYFFLNDLFQYSSIPVLSCTQTLLFCTAFGILLQLLFKISKSIIATSLAHATLYKSIETSLFVVNTEMVNSIYHGPTGIIGITLISLSAIYLLSKN